MSGLGNLTGIFDSLFAEGLRGGKGWTELRRLRCEVECVWLSVLDGRGIGD